MLRILIQYFWPVIVVLLGFTGWLLWRRYSLPLQKREHVPSYIGTAVIVTLLISLGCFGVLILHNMRSHAPYVPAEYKDGQFVPAHKR